MTCRLHRQGSDTSELTHRKHRKRQECHLLRSTVVFNGWPTLSTSRHQKRGGRSLELKGLHPAAFWRPFLALSSRQEEIRPGCCRGFPCVKRKDAHHSQAAQRPSGSPDPRRSLVDLLTPTYLPFQDTPRRILPAWPGAASLTTRGATDFFHVLLASTARAESAFRWGLANQTTLLAAQRATIAHYYPTETQSFSLFLLGHAAIQGRCCCRAARSRSARS
jgi:hypothetical protein